MKILVNAAFDTRASVGVSLYIRRLIPALADIAELTVLALDPEFFAPYSRKIVPIPGCTRFMVRRLLWNLVSRTAGAGHRCDFLLCLTPEVPLLPHLPTFAVVHDLIPLKIRSLICAKEKAVFWAGLQTLRRAEYIISDSKHTRRDLRALRLVAPQRITVAYCGPGILPACDEMNFGAQFGRFILTVGGHAPHKNLTRLFAAFSELGAAPDLRLVVVGNASQEQLARSERAITKLGLRQRVVFLNGISDRQLSSLYRHCQLLAHPSLYEGFGLPVLEAMLHGKPVACSRAASLPEVAGDAALYFWPRSVEEIAQQLQTILDSPALQADLGERGRERARQFTWERTARTIIEHAHTVI